MKLVKKGDMTYMAGKGLKIDGWKKIVLELYYSSRKQKQNII